MSTFDGTQPTDRWMNDPAANPDSGSHLDRIRTELTNSTYQQPGFHGLDLKVFKFGVTDDGSINTGFNLGLGEIQGKVGLVNGVEAHVDLGPIGHAGVGAFGGVDRNGFKVNAGAGGDVLGLVGGQGGVDSRLGNGTGVDAHGRAHVGPIGARAGAGAAIGEDGLDAAAGGGANAGPVLGVRAGGHFGLGDDTQVGASARVHLGDVGTGAGAGVWTDGDSALRPDVYLQGHAGHDRGVIDFNQPIYGDGAPGSAGYGPQAAGGYDSRGWSPYPPQSSGAPGPDWTGYGPRSAGAAGPLAAAGDRPQLVDSQFHGLGRSAPIEVHQLPPIYEANTPENHARVDREIRTKLCDQYSYIVQKGDDFKTIAAKLMPGADAMHLEQEAQKLQKMHEENGYKSLRPGQRLSTEDPYAIDRQTRQMVARHFGLPIPQS